MALRVASSLALVHGEVVVPLSGGGHVGLSTRGPAAFRVRFMMDGLSKPIDSPMVQPDEPDAAFSTAESGISTSFGSITVEKDELKLWDAQGSLLTTSTPLTSSGACSQQQGVDVETLHRVGSPQKVEDAASCCLACQQQSGCATWIFATDGGTSEGNCWLGAGFTGTKAATNRVLGASGFSFSSNNGTLFGRGGGQGDGLSLTATAVSPFVDNKVTLVPYFYSTDGYSALGVVDEHQCMGNHKTNVFPAAYSTDGEHITWSPSGAFELYLMPAKSLDAGTRAYYSLVGTPRVPPRYAFGFLASRYGWESDVYIEEMLEQFRNGSFPIDAIICDFEWFTPENDYNYLPQGKSTYHDFGYNNVTFPNPKQQLTQFREKLHIRMAGIRKPRLGNTELLNFARNNSWLLPGEAFELGYALARNINFSIPEARQWYAEQQKHYYEDGVSFFWNDEGETDYFSFHYWSQAQVESLHAFDSDKRYFAVNRAWSPGVSRFGVATWTGDITPTWTDLANTAGLIQNWGLAGSPYVSCDIGGFTGQTTALLLTRWMQLGVFIPTMRVHSTKTATPHFPFLWPKENADAMRLALNLRYQLIPYHYSLAHHMHRGGQLWMRPLIAEHSEDAVAASKTLQWLDGKLLVAPVLNEDNKTSVYLPKGDWFAFGTGHVTAGPQTLTSQASLTDLPIFVPAGTILPLAPLVQHTDALPGGALQVQVYAGKDAEFTLVEDDGETLAYQKGMSRNTTLKWADTTRTLSWSVEGAALDLPQAFTHIYVTLFEAGRSPSQSKEQEIASDGQIEMPATLVI